MITVYGLKNCDTCRKALKWLEESGAEARLHDFRRDGLDPEVLRGWIESAGIDTLLNRRGTTWRSLDEAERSATDEAALHALMLRYPALIKRPVFVSGERMIVGFSDKQRQALSDWPELS